MRKICSVWVPYNISDCVKQERVLCCQAMLEIYTELGHAEFNRRVIIEDETWIPLSAKPWRNDIKLWIPRGDERPQTAQSNHPGKRSMFLIAYSAV